ncbi:hypothetical protein GDO81_014857 [Engystomops pustulosus]|uniref:Uncharacterized protein n=1 Tax=Engystomops pustulosus TaxID=76066 RepID=A0AAV7ALA3_ENGPU|nr:hypothetical protein GDO81_014857 [Engystomops pustulosus]
MVHIPVMDSSSSWLLLHPRLVGVIPYFILVLQYMKVCIPLCDTRPFHLRNTWKNLANFLLCDTRPFHLRNSWRTWPTSPYVTQGPSIYEILGRTWPNFP